MSRIHPCLALKFTQIFTYLSASCHFVCWSLLSSPRHIFLFWSTVVRFPTVTQILPRGHIQRLTQWAMQRQSDWIVKLATDGCPSRAEVTGAFFFYKEIVVVIEWVLNAVYEVRFRNVSYLWDHCGVSRSDAGTCAHFSDQRNNIKGQRTASIALWASVLRRRINAVLASAITSAGSYACPRDDFFLPQQTK